MIRGFLLSIVQREKTGEQIMLKLLICVAISVVLLCDNIGSAQTTVNGVVPGQLWRTNRVTGSVEVIHIGGRTALMPTKDAWVNIDGERISIGARCDQPVLDGVQQRGYFMPALHGELNKDHRNNVHTITKKEVYGWGDNFDINVVQTATIEMQDGRPISLIYRSVAHLLFNPNDLLLRYPGLANELKTTLQGFDKKGYRRLSFDAQF